AYALLRRANPQAALESARAALALNSGNPQARIAAAQGERALGNGSAADEQMTAAQRGVDALKQTRPIEHDVTRASLLAAKADAADGAKGLGRLLGDAPPGFAAWTVPIEPLFRQVVDRRAVVGALQRLSERAR